VSPATSLAEQLDQATCALRDACGGVADMDDVLVIAGRMADVVGRLGNVYDTLAEWLYADGCPGRHASDDFAVAADHLHAGGAACRHAHVVLVEALQERGWR
jgi:hypothetical protein